MKKAIAFVFCCVWAALAADPVPVIFDTDAYTDYDDVGALAALHALADAGEAEILAIGTCTHGEGNRAAALCEIINAYRGRPGVPLGAARRGGKTGPGGAAFGLPAKYPQWVRHLDSSTLPDAVDVYRAALAEAEDHSVVLITVGFLNNVAELLRVDRDLVARKVKRWACMAFSYPNGKEYNSMGDPAASRYALEHWPMEIPMVVTDWQYGRYCWSGRVLAELPDDGNPVRDVFASQLTPCEKVVPVKGHDQIAGHPSWDQTAVLAGVRGWEKYFNLERGTYRMVGDDGANEWVPDANSKHGRLVDKMTKAEVARVIDELAARPPATKGVSPTRFAPYVVSNLQPRAAFWRVRPHEIDALCRNAKKCSRKEVICHTPLGHPVWALFYGDFDDAPPQTNWSAGEGSTTYRNYYGRTQGGKQTVLFFAGVHGAEPESVCGAVNLIRMLETGKDFAGKTDAALLDLVSKYRFIVVPCVNLDGRAISPDHLRGVDWNTFRHVSQGTWKADGSRVGWRGSKAWFPLPLDKVAYPGGYPNADGYNVMHDACPGDVRTAEAKALLKLAARWRVDAVLNGHSYEHTPSVLKPTGLDSPKRVARGMAIRYRCNRALWQAGLWKSEPLPPEKETWIGEGINLNNLLSLASGCLALTLECSVSYDRPDKPPVSKPTRTYTFEELYAPVNVVLREMLADGLEKPFVDRGGETVLPD